MRLDDYAALEPPDRGRRRTAKPSLPWTPGVEHDDRSGTLTTGALDHGDPDFDQIFRYWNLDPALWDVVPGTLRVNAWEGPTSDGSQIFRQYKAEIRRRTSSAVPVDDQLRRVAKWRARKTPAPHGDATFVVCFADWQVGGRPSSAAFVDRFESTLEQIEQQARRAAAEDCSRLLVLHLGDMVENVTGNYPSQPFEVDLSLRDQIRLVRQCETVALRTLAPLFTETQAVAVHGNHGRGNAKVLTEAQDNADLMAFDGVAEVLTASGAADAHSIRFIAPTETSVVLVETSGTYLLAAHGDQVGGNGDKLRTWWKSVTFTRHGDSDLADLLVTGHRHHFRCEELAEDRYLFICPTLGGPSTWYSDVGGGTSRPGTITFRTAGRKWWALDNVRPHETNPPPVD